LVTVGNTRAHRMWIWGVFDSLCSKGECNGTLHQFFLILRWSLYWLWMGVWPDRHWNSNEVYSPDSPEGQKAGTLLAAGYFGVLWAIMGDLDYMAAILNLPRFSSSTSPCALCQCSSTGDFSWTDNRPTAPWIASCWTAGSWLSWENKSNCPLFTLPGVTALSVCLDYMHCKYLGMDQYMFGSVLWLLVHYVLQYGDAQFNLGVLWDEIKTYYKQHKTPCRFKYLNRLTMFTRKNKAHKLRGKAAEVKHFGEVLLWLWQKHMNPALLLHKRILLMLKLNVQMETILALNKTSFALPAAEAHQFKQYAFDMAQLNNQIAEHFFEDGLPHLFQVTSKLHMVLHCALVAEHMNPRLVWCFSGEDMMKHVQTLASSCVKGLQGHAASIKMVSHYRLGLHLQNKGVIDPL